MPRNQRALVHMGVPESFSDPLGRVDEIINFYTYNEVATVDERSDLPNIYILQYAQEVPELGDVFCVCYRHPKTGQVIQIDDHVSTVENAQALAENFLTSLELQQALVQHHAGDIALPPKLDALLIDALANARQVATERGIKVLFEQFLTECGVRQDAESGHDDLSHVTNPLTLIQFLSFYIQGELSLTESVEAFYLGAFTEYMWALVNLNATVGAEISAAYMEFFDRQLESRMETEDATAEVNAELSIYQALFDEQEARDEIFQIIFTAINTEIREFREEAREYANEECETDAKKSAYYLRLFEHDIQELIDAWLQLIEEEGVLSDDALGNLRTAIGDIYQPALESAKARIDRSEPITSAHLFLLLTGISRAINQSRRACEDETNQTREKLTEFRKLSRYLSTDALPVIEMDVSADAIDAFCKDFMGSDGLSLSLKPYYYFRTDPVAKECITQEMIDRVLAKRATDRVLLAELRNPMTGLIKTISMLVEDYREDEALAGGHVSNNDAQTHAFNQFLLSIEQHQILIPAAIAPFQPLDMFQRFALGDTVLVPPLYLAQQFQENARFDQIIDALGMRGRMDSIQQILTQIADLKEQRDELNQLQGEVGQLSEDLGGLTVVEIDEYIGMLGSEAAYRQQLRSLEGEHNTQKIMDAYRKLKRFHELDEINAANAFDTQIEALEADINALQEEINTAVNNSDLENFAMIGLALEARYSLIDKGINTDHLAKAFVNAEVYRIAHPSKEYGLSRREGELQEDRSKKINNIVASIHTRRDAGGRDIGAMIPAEQDVARVPLTAEQISLPVTLYTVDVSDGSADLVDASVVQKVIIAAIYHSVACDAGALPDEIVDLFGLATESDVDRLANYERFNAYILEASHLLSRYLEGDTLGLRDEFVTMLQDDYGIRPNPEAQLIGDKHKARSAFTDHVSKGKGLFSAPTPVNVSELDEALQRGRPKLK